jgi:transposase-like protein
MKNGSLEKLSGTVEADETFIGGKLALMNKKAKVRKILREGRLPGGGTVGKAIVMGLLERHGNARVKVIPTRNQFDVKHVVRENVAPGSKVYTDELQSYRGLLAQYAHDVIDHTESYVRDNVHTNGMENFWSLFKRTLKGTYVSVEPFHLQAYADEQCFRFNERKGTDRTRFGNVLNHVAGRRLTWNTLTGKEVG